GTAIPSTITQDLGTLSYKVAFQITINSTGEENLRIDIDWRDPNVAAFDHAADRVESIHVQPGTQSIEHTYSLGDFNEFFSLGVGELIVDFSVSHHQSIQLVGDAVIQGTGAAVLNEGVTGSPNIGNRISSTDDIATGTAGPGPTDMFTVTRDIAVLAVTADSNADVYFEGGEVLVKIPAGVLPPIESTVEQPAPPAEPAPPVAFVPLPLLNLEIVDFDESPLESFTTQSEDIFVLRQSDDTGVHDVDGYSKIEEGATLLHPELLRQWVSRQNLGSNNYELWLITTKRNLNGDEVRVERPLLRFDVVNKQPFPTSEESLQPDFPELKLRRIDSEPQNQDGATESSGNDMSLNEHPDLLPVPETVKTVSATTNLSVPDEAEQADEASSPAENPDDSESADSGRTEGTTSSSMIGLAVSGVLQKRQTSRRPRFSTRLSSAVSRVFRRDEAHQGREADNSADAR
ncbi:MAG: hypothetical protein KDA85_20390, partial [Planctomycetaceae bacterium]|nr:hypothetical protein [Planctomycetaceae bacterium]